MTVAGGMLYGSTQCDGGLAEDAFIYAYRHAIAPNSLYPMAYPFTVDYNLVSSLKTNQTTELKRRYSKSPGGRDALIKAVSIQPVVIYVSVNVDSFQMYSSGIWQSDKCEYNTDHAMLLVGYNVQAGYWIVRVNA